MRRKVVLPQPLGPTTETKAPASISISRPPGASRSPTNLLRFRPAGFEPMSLTPGPGHEPPLEPPEARRHGDAGRREHDHAGKQVRHVEGIGRGADQSAEACARA